MLAMSDRVRPCSARWCCSSDGRPTFTVPFSTCTCMSGCSFRDSSPFGPFTVIALPLTVTVTPLGTATGRFPIRDMDEGSLPDEGEELATGVGAARLRVRHEAARRAHNGHAEAIPHARNVPDADVLAKPRARHPLELANHGLAALGILEDHAQHRPAVVGLEDPVVGDEVVLLQNARDLGFHFRYRHVHAAMLRSASIADPREHIGDRVGHAHVVSPCSLSYPRRTQPAPGRVGMRVVTIRRPARRATGYQLAFRTPGIIPLSDRSRKQMRQIPNLRR